MSHKNEELLNELHRTKQKGDAAVRKVTEDYADLITRSNSEKNLETYISEKKRDPKYSKSVIFYFFFFIFCTFKLGV